MPARIRMTRLLFWTTVALLTTSVAAEESAVPLLKPGDYLRPFEVKDCTGPAAGKRLCYFCRYGRRPTIAIFARKLSPQTLQLLKKVDQAVAAHRRARLAAVFVLVSAEPFSTQRALRDAARSQQLKHVPLTIYADSQRLLKEGLRIPSGAEVTVLMWREIRLQFGRKFAKSAALDASAQKQVASELKKLVGSNKR